MQKADYVFLIVKDRMNPASPEFVRESSDEELKRFYNSSTRDDQLAIRTMVNLAGKTYLLREPDTKKVIASLQANYGLGRTYSRD